MRGPVWGGEVTEQRVTGAFVGAPVVPPPPPLVLSVHRQGRLDVITLTPGEASG